jgi:hypothetical protein
VIWVRRIIIAAVALVVFNIIIGIVLMVWPSSTSSYESSPVPLLEFRSDLIDLRPIPWEEAEVLDERSLLLHFVGGVVGGVEPCYGVHHADVVYGEQSVAVTLFAGNVPRPTPDTRPGFVFTT